jgi:four helix bundle protein
MATVAKFEDLEAWKLARELVNLIYDLTDKEIFKRDYDLKNQMRSAAVSIMSNIAEGFERGSDKDFARFLYIAKASCGEIRSQLYVSFDRKYITLEEFKAATEKAVFTSKRISGLIKYLNQ